MTDTLKKLLILTGDPSADVHCAKLIRQFQAKQDNKISPTQASEDFIAPCAQDIEIHAVGGHDMAATGIHLIASHENMGVFGLFGALRAIPYHKQLAQKILQHVATWQPDAILLVDYGGFHLWLAQQLKKKFPHIKRYYFIPPQLWASRPWRVKKIQAAIDHVFCIFPFEVDFYQKHHVPVTFVGHPSLDSNETPMSHAEFCKTHQLDPQAWIIGVFPGSRRSELKSLLADFLATLPLLQEQIAHPLEFVLVQAPSISDDLLNEHLRPHQHLLEGISLKIIKGNSAQVLTHCRAAMMASGTITLEAAIHQTPGILAYKINQVIHFLFKRYLLVPYIGLPNIILNQEVMPEFINKHVKPEQIAQQLKPVIEDGPHRDQTLTLLAQTQQNLSPDDENTQPFSSILMQALTLSNTTPSNILVTSIH